MNSTVLLNKNGLLARREIKNVTSKNATCYYLDKYLENINETPILREARAMKHFLDNVDIEMFPDEILVGNIRSAHKETVLYTRDTDIYDENIKDWILQQQLDTTTTEEFMQKIEKVKSTRYTPWNFDRFTPAERLGLESSAASTTFYSGHLVMDYEYILAKGLDGISGDVVSYRKNSVTNAQEDFYEAMDTILEAIKNYIARNAQKAEEIANSSEGYTRDRFNGIARDLRHISHKKPETFRQALQLVWFVFIACYPDSFGRFDWYLHPFFKKDMESGILNLETTLELLEGLCIKVEETEEILNMTIGGVDIAGMPFYNELTRLCIQATNEVGFKGPNLCLRIADQMPEELWTDVIESLGTGQGLPALYNDKVIINNLVSMGIPLEDARNYALGGCSQINIPGKSLFMNDIGMMNIAKCLELTYFNGFDPNICKQAGLQTGDVEDFDTFDEFMTAFKKQIQYFCKLEADVNNRDVLYRAEREGFAARSLFTQDCLLNGKGLLQGGARYNSIQLELIGITNAADSLMAIKKAVFDDKKVTFRELVDILKEDFRGHEDLRNYLHNDIPKFGNDISEVDQIRKEITEFIYKEIRKQKAALGGNYIPGEVIFVAHEPNGAIVGATPDGRRAGEVLADSAGSSQGMDKNGPTALMNSVLKIPNDIPVTCIILNLKFMKRLWKEKNNQSKIITLLKTFFKQGGMQLQINVCDALVLKEAMEKPEKYSSLIVRVGGYSAYFIWLSPSLQQEIIKRTEY